MEAEAESADENNYGTRFSPNSNGGRISLKHYSTRSAMLCRPVD